jgi:large subunit ribosomal protein L9
LHYCRSQLKENKPEKNLTKKSFKETYPMKVLLCEDVKEIGYYGDIVEVAEGYARNFLLPQRLAILPDEKILRSMAQEKGKRTDQRLRERKRLEAAAAAVKGAEAVISSKANEQGVLFGSVSPKEIAANLQAQGFDVTEYFFSLKEHIKTVGSHEVTLRFAEDLSATVTVVVVAEGRSADQPQPAPQEPQQSDQPIPPAEGQ